MHFFRLLLLLLLVARSMVTWPIFNFSRDEETFRGVKLIGNFCCIRPLLFTEAKWYNFNAPSRLPFCSSSLFPLLSARWPWLVWNMNLSAWLVHLGKELFHSYFRCKKCQRKLRYLPLSLLTVIRKVNCRLKRKLRGENPVASARSRKRGFHFRADRDFRFADSVAWKAAAPSAAFRRNKLVFDSGSCG